MCSILPARASPPSYSTTLENYVLRVTNIKAGNIVHVGLELKPREPLLRGAEDTAVSFLHISFSMDVGRFVSRRMNFRDKSTLKFIINEIYDSERREGWDRIILLNLS